MPATFASLPEIERVPVEKETLRAFRQEDEFVGLGVSLMIEVGSYACLAAGTTGLSPTGIEIAQWSAGIWFASINCAMPYLDQTTKRRMELLYILIRLIFETAVTIESFDQTFFL